MSSDAIRPRSPIAGILRNFTVMSAGELLSKAIGFVATAYLARILGVIGFGKIGFAIALLSYFKLITNGGLDTYGAREVARDPSLAPALARRIRWMQLGLACIAAVLMLAFVLIFRKDPTDRWVISLYTLSLFPAALLLDWYFYAAERIGWVVVGSVLTQAVYAAGILLFVHTPANLARIPIAQVVSELVAAVVLLVAFTRSRAHPQPAAPLTDLAQTIREAWPIGISNAMRTINYSFDIVLLGFLLPGEPLGLYVADYRFIYFLLAFGILYFRTFLPQISRAVQEGPEAAGHLLSESLRAGAIATFPMAAGASLLAGPIVRMFFGPEYLKGAPALIILVWSAVCIILNGTFRQTLIAGGRQNLQLKLTAASAALNVALNLVLIPRWGIEGAAVATVVAEFLLLVLCARAVDRMGYRFSLWKAVALPTVCTLLMSVGVYFTRPLGLWISMASGVALYAALLFAGMGAADRKNSGN